MGPFWGLALYAVHADATCAMAGLIWFVQIVHYPLFGAVPPAAFARYENLNTQLTNRVVAPTMGIELSRAALRSRRRRPSVCSRGLRGAGCYSWPASGL